MKSAIDIAQNAFFKWNITGGIDIEDMQIQTFEFVITPDDFDSEHSGDTLLAFKTGSDAETKAKDMFAWIDNNRSSVINIQCYAEYESKGILSTESSFNTYSSVSGGELTKQGVLDSNGSTSYCDILKVQCSGMVSISNLGNSTNGSTVMDWAILKEYEDSNNAIHENYGVAGIIIGSFLAPREKLSSGQDYILKLKFRLFYIED